MPDVSSTAPAQVRTWVAIDAHKLSLVAAALPGQRQRRGPITKSGSQHARRLLVEAAWHVGRPERRHRPLRARASVTHVWAADPNRSVTPVAR